MMSPAAQSVLDFWFNSDIETQWFGAPDATFDAWVAQRFAPIHARAGTGGLASWESEPESCLALVIVLDQFPRHIFRGTAMAYATDAQALEVSRRALQRGHDQALSTVERRFLYMPFMHSENLADQERSLALFRSLNDAASLEAAEKHHAVILRFGRFPFRNAALDRASTEEEKRHVMSGRRP